MPEIFTGYQRKAKGVSNEALLSDKTISINWTKTYKTVHHDLYYKFIIGIKTYIPVRSQFMYKAMKLLNKMKKYKWKRVDWVL